MQLNTYMSEIYPNLILKPPLFYNWKYRIRYELGNPNELNNKKYIEGAVFRAITLFKEINSPNDDMLIVLYVHLPIKRNTLKQRKVKLLNRSVKSKEVLYKIRHKVIPYIFEDEDDMETHRYILKCRVCDISYHYLLSFICKQKPRTYYDLFFLNVSKDFIFHPYDDCGCDVIAPDKEKIKFLYEKYNGWILDYDRKEIDSIFNLYGKLTAKENFSLV